MTPQNTETPPQLLYAVTNTRRRVYRLHQHRTRDQMKTLCGHLIAKTYQEPRDDIPDCQRCAILTSRH